MSGVSSGVAFAVAGAFAVACAVLIARVVRTQRAGPATWLAAVALAVGLGTSAGVGLERTQDEELARLDDAVAAVKPEGDADGDSTDATTEADVHLEANGPSATGGEDGTGEETAAPTEDAAPTSAPDKDAIVPPPPPLERQQDDWVARYRREARAVATDPSRCTDAEELARVWAMRQAVERDDPSYMRLHIATKWLERCRGKLRRIRLHRIRVDRMERRRAFVPKLKRRLHDDGQPVKIELAGPTDEKLRVVGGTFDAESSRALVEGGLGAELAELGFLRVTFVRYTQRHRYPLEGTRAEQLVHAELEKLGIAEPFEL